MPAWGCYEEVKIMTPNDGRHFCCWCNKLIRCGEQFKHKTEPKPFRRAYRHIYLHYPDCPSVAEKRLNVAKVKYFKKGEQGFLTLVEWLIVLAILGVLAAVVIPTVLGIGR